MSERLNGLNKLNLPRPNRSFNLFNLFNLFNAAARFRFAIGTPPAKLRL